VGLSNHGDSQLRPIGSTNGRIPIVSVLTSHWIGVERGARLR
jgi:hypothetical protein